MRVLFSEEEIRQAVAGLAARIDADYAGKTPLLIGVLTGAFIFLADLSRALTVPCEIDFVRLDSYGAGTASSGSVRRTLECKTHVAGRDVIVVDEIVDTGLTLAAMLEDLRKAGAASVAVCTLVNKLARREVEVPTHYVGFTVEDGFLVGYGLDVAEGQRTLPAIYIWENNATKS